MLAKRIIPRLDVTEGRLTRAPGNEELVENDPVELSRFYDAAGADEILLYDRGETSDRSIRFEELVEKVTKAVFLPLIAGGGVSSPAQIRSLLRAGADRVLLQSHALRHPEFLQAAVERFGAERILLSIEVVRRRTAVVSPSTSASETAHVPGTSDSGSASGEDFLVVCDGGKRVTDRKALKWAAAGSAVGVGEILVTSLDRAETKLGFDLPLIREVSSHVDVPLLVGGGAGSVEHFVELFTTTTVAGAVASQIFHHRETSIKRVKRQCHAAGVPLRLQVEEVDVHLQGEAAGRLPQIETNVPTPEGPTAGSDLAEQPSGEANQEEG